jgi:hypothetical protein
MDTGPEPRRCVFNQTALLAALAPVRIAFGRRSRMVTRLSLALALEWI